MKYLKDKTILIVSPQSWGRMMLSKHHYAIALAKRGNRVFFLNPPSLGNSDLRESVAIFSSEVHQNLFLINHRLFFPYFLKFHALWLFHFLMKWQVKQILNRIEGPVDIVWSFDIDNLYFLNYFGSRPFKIFHPVDEPLAKTAIDAARGAQIMFSVTVEILEKYPGFNGPKHFINHGVSQEFISSGFSERKDGPVRIGYAGNLLRPDIDIEVLMEIVKENDQCIFEFWGSYQLNDSNIGGADDSRTRKFIQDLKSSPNVHLHGVAATEVLAREFRGMDCFLICYDVLKDQSKGTNFHKMLEFLGSGKVVISNNVTTYKNRPELIQMVEERTHNKSLPRLFKSVIGDLKRFNSQEIQEIRIAFAKEKVYDSQLSRIEGLIESFLGLTHGSKD